MDTGTSKSRKLFWSAERTGGTLRACTGMTGWNRKANVNLQCYARLCGNQWHAICTDLDIAADGASLEEARASMAVCVELYLESAEALPPDDRCRWLRRKAPWHVRWRMALLNALHWLRGSGTTPLSFILEPDELTLAEV